MTQARGQAGDWQRMGITHAETRSRRRESRIRRQRQLAGRAAILLTAIGLPAFAAQGQWGNFGLMIGGQSERAAPKPMPFETAGESFPGSAFYYLEDAPDLTSDLADLREGDGLVETAGMTESHGVGAAAKAFRAGGSGIDKARALQCLSMAVYYEAASESYAGQEAVAQVVLNRVAHPAYPASVCGVVFQGSERSTGCQFTFTCDGSLARKPSRQGWARAQSIALAALAGEVYKPVGLATHYHTNYVNPYWAGNLDFVSTIGAHRFYRWKGSAGQAGAFDQDYAGTEPLAAPNVRRAKAEVPGPVAPSAPPPNSAIGADGRPDILVGAAPVTTTAPVRSPAPATNRLPNSGKVKEEYANSGRWLREPGK